MALPMPREAPVTNAVFPVSNMGNLLLYNVQVGALGYAMTHGRFLEEA